MENIDFEYNRSDHGFGSHLGGRGACNCLRNVQNSDLGAAAVSAQCKTNCAKQPQRKLLQV